MQLHRSSLWHIARGGPPSSPLKNKIHKKSLYIFYILKITADNGKIAFSPEKPTTRPSFFCSCRGAERRIVRLHHPPQPGRGPEKLPRPKAKERGDAQAPINNFFNPPRVTVIFAARPFLARPLGLNKFPHKIFPGRMGSRGFGFLPILIRQPPKAPGSRRLRHVMKHQQLRARQRCDGIRAPVVATELDERGLLARILPRGPPLSAPPPLPRPDSRPTKPIKDGPSFLPGTASDIPPPTKPVPNRGATSSPLPIHNMLPTTTLPSSPANATPHHPPPISTIFVTTIRHNDEMKYFLLPPPSACFSAGRPTRPTHLPPHLPARTKRIIACPFPSQTSGEVIISTQRFILGQSQ